MTWFLERELLFSDLTFHIFREENLASHYLLRGGAILHNKVDSLEDCK